MWSAARTELETTPLSAQPWTAQWLEETRRGGASPARTRTRRARSSSRRSISWRRSSPARTRTPASRGRGELATAATGSAYGLDDGTLLCRLVLRGIAPAHDTEFPTDAPARRALWRTASVTPDEVSSTVLTHGLRPPGGTWREAVLRERADHHLETHITLRELRTLSL
ncbi:TIGR02679 domain-containing protein [Streptomyces coelicoflavus]|uniref:TIGR02679 domain-containing protein n=1 Tax=Streptomyces coelicoflavus TaxID=285562 RepID=UPI003F49E749